MIKRILSLIFSFILISTFSVHASATNLTPFDYQTVSDDDLNRILDNQEYILNDINAALEAEKTGEQITELSLDHIAKVYIDTDIFSLKSTDYNSFTKAFGDQNYVYTCTQYLTDVKVEYTLAIASEVNNEAKKIMTDEELNEVTQKAGKWNVSSVSVLQNEQKSYTDLIDQLSFEKYDNVMIVGSLKGFFYPIAIGFVNDQATDIITILENIDSYNIFEFVPDTMASNDTNDTNHVYDYASIVEIVNEHYTADSEDLIVGGENVQKSAIDDSKNIAVPIGICIAAAAVIVLIIFKYPGCKTNK